MSDSVSACAIWSVRAWYCSFSARCYVYHPTPSLYTSRSLRTLAFSWDMQRKNCSICAAPEPRGIQEKQWKFFAMWRWTCSKVSWDWYHNAHDHLWIVAIHKFENMETKKILNSVRCLCITSRWKHRSGRKFWAEVGGIYLLRCKPHRASDYDYDVERSSLTEYIFLSAGEKAFFPSALGKRKAPFHIGGPYCEPTIVFMVRLAMAYGVIILFNNHFQPACEPLNH